MATRAERMQQRIRGAGHGQIEEVSFQLDLGGDTTTDESSPAAAPNAPTQARSPSRTPVQNSTEPEPANHVAETSLTNGVTPRSQDQVTTPRPIASTTGTPLSQRRATTNGNAQNTPSASTPKSHRVTRLSHNEKLDYVEEVGESPAEAPGTGQRRIVQSTTVTSSSVRLQQLIVGAEEEANSDPLSSPTEQRTQRSRASLGLQKTPASRRRSPLASEADKPDELSPEQTTIPRSVPYIASPELASERTAEEVGSGAAADRTKELSPEEDLDRVGTPGQASVDLRTRPETRRSRSSPEQVEASAVSDPQPSPAQPDSTSNNNPQGASLKRQQLRISRKRRREGETESPENSEVVEKPVEKRRRKQKEDGREKQKQTKSNARPGRPAKPKNSQAEPKKPRRSNSDADGNGSAIVIDAQRFTKRRKAPEGEDADFDIIAADIPYSKRAGVNSLDVLTSLCSDVVDDAMEALEKARAHAGDAASKREIQIKTRALVAYRAELNHRLLGHTIHVDHMHALRQRIKSEQKEKAMLREEIMRLRAEREHVAIQKDAIRAKHEKQREQMTHQLNLSSSMHDVELAVERGRAAPKLPPAKAKEAELANLELLMSRMADQCSSKSDAGGTLRQLKDFNAFLERAAVALETRQLDA